MLLSSWEERPNNVLVAGRIRSSRISCHGPKPHQPTTSRLECAKSLRKHLPAVGLPTVTRGNLLGEVCAIHMGGHRVTLPPFARVHSWACWKAYTIPAQWGSTVVLLCLGSVVSAAGKSGPVPWLLHCPLAVCVHRIMPSSSRWVLCLAVEPVCNQQKPVVWLGKLGSCGWSLGWWLHWLRGITNCNGGTVVVGRTSFDITS